MNIAAGGHVDEVAGRARRRDRLAPDFVDRRRADRDSERQRPEHDGVHGAEDRRRRADAERERGTATAVKPGLASS